MNTEEPWLLSSESCCFTGHRILPQEVNESVQLYQNLRNIIERLVKEDGIVNFYAGGALGFDTMAATAVLQMKEKYPQIKLILALPFAGQAEDWSLSDQLRYEDIKEKADRIKMISQEFTDDCMKKRNYYMVDHSCACIYYLLNSPRSGTLQTVQYARKSGLRMIDLSSEEITEDYYGYPVWKEQFYTEE